MSCCGQSRGSSVPRPATRPTEHRPGGATALRFPAAAGPAGGGPRATRLAGGAVRYRYVGESRLIVEGPLTGRRYFFDQPGAELAVEARDADSLIGVPVLHRV